MGRRDREDIDFVRHVVEGSLQTGVPIVRLKVRIDYYPVSGDLDFSLVGWEHPEGRLVVNNIWGSYDASHRGMAAADIVASVYSALEIFPDPFP